MLTCIQKELQLENPELKITSFKVDDDDHDYCEEDDNNNNSDSDNDNYRALPIFYKDTHKRGYIELRLQLLSSSLPTFGFLESGSFQMNIVTSTGSFLPHSTCGPYLDPTDVRIGFETIRQPFQTLGADKKKVTKLKYFDSRSPEFGGPKVPVLRFRVECITTKLGLPEELITSGIRVKVWGRGIYEGVSAVSPRFQVKSKNPKYKYQCVQGDSLLEKNKRRRNSNGGQSKIKNGVKRSLRNVRMGRGGKGFGMKLGIPLLVEGRKNNGDGTDGRTLGIGRGMEKGGTGGKGNGNKLLDHFKNRGEKGNKIIGGSKPRTRGPGKRKGIRRDIERETEAFGATLMSYPGSEYVKEPYHYMDIEEVGEEKKEEKVGKIEANNLTALAILASHFPRDIKGKKRGENGKGGKEEKGETDESGNDMGGEEENGETEMSESGNDKGGEEENGETEMSESGNDKGGEGESGETEESGDDKGGEEERGESGNEKGGEGESGETC
ncbi:hypothetical protein TrCOL_g4597 [Triparma columacea]|uniref:Uncharacterized protein n=1 Tax=Triparma columacea TaxID=722753 RepID=A0A9W7L3Z2_9STRA|nr:hypothetical protein TrCOL_g4597 [Triparma columacea]